MKPQVWIWSAAIAVGTATVLTLYLVIISRQGNRPVAWFVAALVIGGALPTIGLVTPSVRKMCFAVSAFVLTVLAMLAGFSIGVFLVPVVLTAWIAFATDSQYSAHRRRADRI